MKKIAIAMTALALMVGNVGHAQNTTNGTNRAPANRTTTGAGAQTARSGVVDDWAWGLGLGALVVFGTVVGVTVAAAVQNPSGFSH